jgi:uncharacterized membrane protein (UPF0127 family)
MSAPGPGAWRRRLDPLPAIALQGGLIVHVAAGPFARLRGLASLQDLPGEHGLLLPRTRSVHTFGMRFALDLIWLARDGTVVEVEEAVAPRRHAMARAARSVVEVRAGWGTRFVEAGLETALRR